MQSIYLSFQDQAEANSVLCTVKQEPVYGYVPIEGQFKQVYTYTYVSPTNGEPVEYHSEQVLTEIIASDDILCFEENEVVPLTLVKTESVQDTQYVQTGTKNVYVPNYQNIDVVGVVYKRPPIPMPENYVPEPYPAPNYGVNVLLLDNEDITPLQPYIVQPKNPVRVWAT